MSSAHNAERDRFPSTRWSLVVEAAGQSSARGQAALADLCAAYWYPLYAFVRREGHSASDAQDLTQGFFLRLIEKQDLAAVDRDKGRFRSFLMASLKHYLINEHDKRRAAKRGGGRAMLSLDFGEAEQRFAADFSAAREEHCSPAAVFDREWAVTTLDAARARLAQEHDSDGKRRQFDELQSCLTGEAGHAAYREVAERLGTTEGAVKVAVHRLRARFRELLREQISQTVASEEEIDDEIRDLFEALRGR